MYRFRRLRRDERIRSMMRENRLYARDFIYPVFVMEGEQVKNPVESMPGVFQYSVDCLDGILEQVKAAGIGGIMLFGIPSQIGRAHVLRIPGGVRLMPGTASRKEQSAIYVKSILKSTSWRMCVCVSTRPTAIAGWCAGRRF